MVFYLILLLKFLNLINFMPFDIRPIFIPDFLCVSKRTVNA